MKKINNYRAIAILMLLTVAQTSFAATTYGGVTLPDGDISFADAVHSYTTGGDVGVPFEDPNDVLGTPDWNGSTGAYSLGNGGSLVVQFTDNSLTTSGNSDNDLWIYEIGGAVETFFVSISTDANTWISLGSLSGQPGGIDIDAFAGVVTGTLYSFVMLVDDPNQGQTGFPYSEADIDAIAAISSGAAVPNPAAVPLPAAVWLFGSGLMGLLGFSRRNKAHAVAA